MSDIHETAEALIAAIRSLGSCAVAFSGGVDSAVVAKAAQLALGERAVAVTGVSPSLAAGELDEARELADRIGIRHVVINTTEFENPNYTRNDPNRCYYCKTDLYEQFATRLDELKVDFVVNGANLDDRGDYRPGERAAAEQRVRSPLADCGCAKRDVRALAEFWNLPIWDKPAMPCLASRVAYGEEVTPERLSMIDQAEQFLRAEGFRELRVRYHRGDLARVEVPVSEVERFLPDDFRQRMVEHFRKLGFKFVTLDLEGLRSGSMNRVISVESLQVR
jgi:pyridinium-3,5-biscarboxylic acid mononucleotide sulfurtransferase